MHRALFAAVLLCTLQLLAVLAGADDGKQAAQVQELERRCEQAREAKLKPLREAEIGRCKADKRNDPGYCERHFRDYGTSTRRTQRGGVIHARQFDDLPECVAARAARDALRRG